MLRNLTDLTSETSKNEIPVVKSTFWRDLVSNFWTMPGKVPTADVPLTQRSSVRALSPRLASSCHRGSPGLQPQPGQGLAMLQGQELSRNPNWALLQRQAPSQPRRGCVVEADAAVLVFVLPSDSASPKRFPLSFQPGLRFYHTANQGQDLKGGTERKASPPARCSRPSYLPLHLMFLRAAGPAGAPSAMRGAWRDASAFFSGGTSPAAPRRAARCTCFSPGDLLTSLCTARPLPFAVYSPFFPEVRGRAGSRASCWGALSRRASHSRQAMLGLQQRAKLAGDYQMETFESPFPATDSSCARACALFLTCGKNIQHWCFSFLGDTSWTGRILC